VLEPSVSSALRLDDPGFRTAFLYARLARSVMAESRERGSAVMTNWACCRSIRTRGTNAGQHRQNDAALRAGWAAQRPGQVFSRTIW